VEEVGVAIAMIGEPAQSANTRLQVVDQPGVAALAAAGKIPAHLAVALDAATGLAVVATRDGRLRVHDPANWSEIRSRAIDRPAYHLQIDPDRRLLYAASTATSDLRLNDLGERVSAGGDVHVYDLDAVLGDSVGGVEPARRFPVEAHLAALILSPDGRQLYYLAETNTSCRLGRIDTVAWQADTSLDLRTQRPGLLAMVPGGRTLYALVSGRLFTVDTGTWAATDQVVANFSVQAMVADKQGRLYLAERARGVQVKVIDVASRRTIARFTAETDGLPSLALLPDAGRLVVATSAFASGRVWLLDVSGQVDQSPLLGQAGSDRGRLLRGAVSVTADGRHLLTSTGQVFRLPS
jgi:DNA-binding beta-propeller fold protein YncE